MSSTAAASPADSRDNLVRRRLRPALRLLTIVGALLAPVAYIDAAGVLPMIQALLPPVGLLGVGVALAAVATRDLLTAGVALAASLALLVPVLPLSPRPELPESGAPASDLRIVTVNTEFGGADPAAIVAAVRGTGDGGNAGGGGDDPADVLVLLEETPEHWAALSEAGLTDVLPHATGTLSTSAAGTVVVTRAPVTCLDPAVACGEVVPAVRAPDEPFTQVDVRLSDGTPLRAAHPFPPLGTASTTWRASLARIEQWVHDTHADEPRLVVTGDFNAGPAHPAFRAMADGLVQAPRAWPWQPTWPRGSWIPPFVQIDHALSRGFAVVDEGTLDIPGTDHAGIRVHLRPTAPQ